MIPLRIASGDGSESPTHFEKPNAIRAKRVCQQTHCVRALDEHRGASTLKRHDVWPPPVLGHVRGNLYHGALRAVEAASANDMEAGF